MAIDVLPEPERRDPRLDRRPMYDDRSRQYQVRPLLEAVGEVRRTLTRKAWRPSPVTLDQGADGACVRFSEAHLLMASPMRYKPLLTNEQAAAQYREIQLIDEFADTPPEEGTSLNAGARYMRDRGEITEWRWCGAGSQTAIDDLRDTLDFIGSAQLGIPWYWSMMSPTPSGRLVVDPGSGLAGYHALAAIVHRYVALPGEGTRKWDVAGCHQTWGPWGVTYYGVPGFCWIELADLEAKLLPRAVWGEALVPVESHLAALVA